MPKTTLHLVTAQTFLTNLIACPTLLSIDTLIASHRRQTLRSGELSRLIEGRKDGRVFRKVSDPQVCQIFASGSRPAAEGALYILKAAGTAGVLCLVDADSDHLKALRPTHPDMLLTHTRDIEGVLFESGVLRDLLPEFDLPADAFGADPDMAAIEAAVPLGLVRYISEVKGWRVSFPKIDFAAFINAATLECDDNDFCGHISSLSTGVTPAQILTELNRLRAVGHGPLKVARGHDVTGLLAMAIVKRRGVKRKSGALITSDLIESFIRAAYRKEAFRATELFRDIRGWEDRNKPYRILLV